MKTRRPSIKRQQRGTVLVISLVILLIMTLVGIASMQTTVLEEKMTGNLRDQNMAFQAGEAGLREALDWLEEKAKSASGFPAAKSDGSNLIYSECSVNASGSFSCSDGTTVPSISWMASSSNSEAYGAFMDNDVASITGSQDSDPRTVIEERYAPPPEFDQAIKMKGVLHYSQTTLGYGGTTSARSLSQSIVSMPRL